MSIRSVLKSFFVRGAYPTEEQFADLIDSCLNIEEDSYLKSGDNVSELVNDTGYVTSENVEQKIYEPTTEPSIVTGTPNILTLDLNNARQAIFEPRLSVGTRSINVDFTLALANAGDGRYFDMTLSLSGTRIITLPSDFRVSVPSTIGTYDGVSSPRTLTLACGTDDVIIMIAKYIKTEAVWDLSVNEITA